jgi:hypothetical protein
MNRIMNRIFKIPQHCQILGILSLLIVPSGSATLNWPGKESQLSEGFHSLFLQDYPLAQEKFQSIFKNDSMSLHYWMGAISMARYEDWGDTLSLTRAEKSWTQAKSRNCESQNSQCITLKSLSALQLSYIQRLRGNSLTSAKTALWAQGRLEKDSTDEGRIAEKRSAPARDRTHRGARRPEGMNSYGE